MSQPAEASTLDESMARRKPGRPRDVATDRLILEATWAEVAVHGLAGLSVEKVAARCGCSKATIYRRWASKEALVLDAWAAAEAPVSIADTGSILTDLEAMHAEFDRQMSKPALAILLPQIVAARHQNPGLAAQFQEFAEQQRLPLRQLLERARTRGEIRMDVDIELIAGLISGPFLMALLFEDRHMSLDESRAVNQLILHGIAAV